VSAAIRAAEVGLKTADEQFRLARQGTQRDASVAFYDLLLAKELHRFAAENLEQKKRHSDEAHKKFAAGVATDYDVLAADVSVQNARPDVIRTENLIKISRDRLCFVLGIEGETVDAAGSLDTGVAAPPTFEESLQIARTRRPELADLRLRLGIYNELVTIAAADNKPRLDLKGSVGWHQLDVGGLRNDGAAWNIGVYLSFPFFDGFKTDGRVQQARSDLVAKQIEEQKLLDSISLEVRSAINNVREAGEIVAALAGTVRQAERLREMAEKGYEFGVKIRLEVDDAQLNLLQAQSNLARARRDYLAAQTNLDWTTGRLGE
jgi:HAE1 family hydrophobic/amphiphilic exporter-1